MVADVTGSDAPNILFLVLDTARARNFSCYGHDRLTTPNIDEFAADHIQCERAISVAPWTLPSHASLFTGVPPSVHGTNSTDSKLPGELRTLPAVLRELGYTTTGISSNPWLTSQFGITRGFDEYHHLFGPLATESYREFVKTVTDGTLPYHQRLLKLLDAQSLPALVKNTTNAAYRYATDRDDNGASQALGYAKQTITADGPSFLFANFLEPHLRYEPPPEYRRKFMPEDVPEEDIAALTQDAVQYNVGNAEMTDEQFALLERLYDAEINYVDHCLGQLFEHMRDHSEFSNSLIFILGDHGENIGEHGLMGHQYSIHDTLLHVPLLVKLPSDRNQTETITRRVSLLDIPATVSSFLPDSEVPDSFSDQQEGEGLLTTDGRDRPVFAEYLNPMPSVERLRTYADDSFDVDRYDRRQRAIYDGEWKLIRDSNGSVKLSNLAIDPGETTDRSADETDRREELQELLDTTVARYDEGYISRTTGPSEATEDRLSDLGYL